jgi:hypothetical protein
MPVLPHRDNHNTSNDHLHWLQGGVNRGDDMKTITYTGIIHTDCFLKKNTKFGWVTIPVLLKTDRNGLVSKKFKVVKVTIEEVK